MKGKTNYDLGETIGSFRFLRTELVGKNKTWIMECACGAEKRFWKYSAIPNQRTCGCGVDEIGLTKEKRRMLKSRYASYVSGAKKRKILWHLTFKDFSEITSGFCVYCGNEPILVNYFANAPSLQKDSPNRDWSKYSIRFNGVDRINSEDGYYRANCVSCCSRCNRAKNDMTLEQFKLHVEKMYTWMFGHKHYERLPP